MALYDESILKDNAKKKIGEISLHTVNTLMIDWETLFNRNIQLGRTNVILKSDRNIAQVVDEKVLYTRADVTGFFNGKMYFLFPFEDAIIIAGLMISLQDDEIKRKSSIKSFTNTDVDAYKEACNIMCGSVAKAMRMFLNRDFSITQEETKILDFFKSRIDFNVDFPELPWIISEHFFQIPGFKKEESKLWQIYSKNFTVEILSLFNMSENEILGIATKRILFVDPSLQSQKQFLGAMEISGIKGFATSSYAQADEILRMRAIDYIIVDVNAGFDEKMQGSGIAICKKIKTSEKYKAIPVVICSSNIDKTIIVEALRNGACDFIVKPFSENVFTERIKKWT